MIKKYWKKILTYVLIVLVFMGYLFDQFSIVKYISKIALGIIGIEFIYLCKVVITSAERKKEKTVLFIIYALAAFVCIANCIKIFIS